MGNQISLARSYEPYEPYEVKQFEGKKLKTYLKKKPHCINQLEKYENGNLETLCLSLLGKGDLKMLNFS